MVTLRYCPIAAIISGPVCSGRTDKAAPRHDQLATHSR